MKRRQIKTEWLPLRPWELLRAAAFALALPTGVTSALADLDRDSDDIFIETVPLNQRKVPPTVPLPFEFPTRAVPFIPSNVNVSNLVGHESEVSISINPTDPLNMVVVGHSPGIAAMNTFWTTDGGENWNLVALGDDQDGGAGCHRADPTVAFDSNGIVYAAYFTFFCGSATKTIFVARSDDGGQTYPQITAAVIEPTGQLDKEILGTGPDPAVAGQQNVYIAYRLDVGSDAQLHLTTSTDGGLTFPTDVIINDDSIAGDDRATFGMPAVGPNGELYVIWDDFSNSPTFSEIMVDASTDAGVTWGVDVQIGTTAVTRENANGFFPTGGIRYHIPAQPDRGILAVPSIAVDRSGGTNDGRIYAAYTVVGGGGAFDTDVVMHFSDDHAATWSLPVTVSDDGGVRSQFLPWVSVDNCSGSLGRVAVVWYDARNDATDETVQAFLGVSEDGGLTFEPSIQVASGQSDQSLNNPDRTPNNYLEYIGVDVCGSIACMVWADNSANLSDLDFFSDCVPLINLPPVAACQPFSPNADNNCCVTVTVADIDGGSSDPNGASDIATWCITAVDGTPVGCLNQVEVCGAGAHLVTLTIIDLSGLSSSCDAEVNVIDGAPPSITVTLNRTVLWPPNHKLVDIVATVGVTDNCDPNPTFVLTSITSDEPDNDLGDGDKSSDIQGAVFGTPDLQFQLRSERASLGDGRVYTIAYTASDESGNTRESTVEVIVPHDQKGAALTSIGFVSSGSSFEPEAQQFALVLLSVAPGTPGTPSLDATHVPSAETYVGNTVGALRPTDRWLSDMDGDGLQDVAFFYAVGLAEEIAARSDREDGPLGMHYTSGDGVPYLVQDIFALGTPVPLGGYNGPTGAEESLIVSPLAETRFTGAYPNPFGRDVTLAFTLSRQEPISMTVYDGRGARVCSVIKGSRPAGRHQVAWDGRDDGGRRVASGVYYVQLIAGEYHSARNVVLLK